MFFCLFLVFIFCTKRITGFRWDVGWESDSSAFSADSELHGKMGMVICSFPLSFKTKFKTVSRRNSGVRNTSAMM